MPYDLFTPPEDTAHQPAPCGFLPMDGWPHKWARQAHLDNCQDCKKGTKR